MEACANRTRRAQASDTSRRMPPSLPRARRRTRSTADVSATPAARRDWTACFVPSPERTLRPLPRGGRAFRPEPRSPASAVDCDTVRVPIVGCLHHDERWASRAGRGCRGEVRPRATAGLLQVVHFPPVRLTTFLVMIGLLVHLQVAGVLCACSHEEGVDAAHARDSHAAGHEGAATDRAPCSHRKREPRHERPGAPPSCECVPAPVFAAPETATITAFESGGSVSLKFRISPCSPLVDARACGIEGRHARPPPPGRGVNSHSPWSLPVLRI